MIPAPIPAERLEELRSYGNHSDGITECGNEAWVAPSDFPNHESLLTWGELRTLLHVAQQVATLTRERDEAREIARRLSAGCECQCGQCDLDAITVASWKES